MGRQGELQNKQRRLPRQSAEHMRKKRKRDQENSKPRQGQERSRQRGRRNSEQKLGRSTKHKNVGGGLRTSTAAAEGSISELGNKIKAT